jgi:hypothetical protein
MKADHFRVRSYEGQPSVFTRGVRPDACPNPWGSVPITVHLWFHRCY